VVDVDINIYINFFCHVQSRMGGYTRWKMYSVMDRLIIRRCWDWRLRIPSVAVLFLLSLSFIAFAFSHLDGVSLVDRSLFNIS